MIEHQRNIEHLFNFISRSKNMSDRYKDPNDFYAFPVYFLREDKKSKDHRNKKLRKIKSESNFKGLPSCEKS